MYREEHHNCKNIDELLQTTEINIRKFGLQVIMVKSTDYLPSFAYSIGLWKTYSHPEIICFGLPNELGHAIINDVAEIIKKGEKIQIDKIYFEIFENSKAAFLKVDTNNIGDYFKVAIKFNNSNSFPALQLVWTDRNDKLPWEQNFEEEFVFKQPLLDRNTDFKFLEEKNLGIFTTRQWLELNKPILRVIHDNDGDWQFLTGDQLPEDIRLVALEQMTLKDNTLNEIFDLDYGQSAERESIGGHWTRENVENEEE